MHIELQQAMQHLVAEQSLNLKEVSRFTPVDFRLGIQYLVAQVKPDMQWLDLSINFAYFAATLVVVVISWIMDAGRKLQEENELTI